VPVDDELETIVLKALAKERDGRYQTAGDLGRDIDHYLAHEPIEAKRDSGLYLLRKTLQRYRVATAVAAAFVLLATGSAIALGVMYGRQVRLRAEAEHQAQVAGQRFDQVRDLASFFVLHFDPLIEHLPGAAPARQALVEKGLAYLDVLARQAEQNLDLQLELAAAYMKIGDVQGDLAGANLGDLRGAVESYRKAQRILDDAAVVSPAEARIATTTLLNLNKLGDALAALGDPEAALAAHRQVLDLGERALRERPTDVLVRNNLGSAHERIGTLLQARGELDAALDHFEQFLETARARAAADPQDPWQLRPVGVGLVKLAGIHYARGRLADALQNYREFLDLAVRLREAHPENVVARRDLGAAHQWIGILLADQGERDAALASFEQSNLVFETLLRDDPQDVAAQLSLATNYSKLGEVHLAAHRIDEAAAQFRRSATLIEDLARRQSARPDILRLLGVAYYKMAELELVHAKDETQMPAARRARWEAAREWLTRSQGVFGDMRDRNILPPADAGVPAELAGEIGQCDAALRDLTEATSAPVSLDR